jgi:predicted dehydrogenase
MFIKKKIRVLMVGFGNIAQVHAGQLLRIQQFELAGVVDGRAEAVESARVFRADVPAYPTLAAALESGAFDAAVISTPHHVHLEQCRECLAAGLHVLCEKPVCLNLEDFDRLTAAADRAGRLLVAGHMARYWPNVAWARQQLASGVIGELRHILRDRITQQQDAGNRAWAHNPAEAGGWLLYGTGIHEIDAMLHITGARVERAEAFACVNNPGWNDWDELSVCGHLSGGAVFNLNQTLNGGGFRLATKIIGTKGTLDLLGESIATLNGATTYLPQNNAFHTQLLAFARSILQGEENRGALAAVRDTMAALDLIKDRVQVSTVKGGQS